VELFQKVIRRKTENEKLPKEQRIPTDNYLLFCEHPHVYTLGDPFISAFNCGSGLKVKIFAP